MKNAYKKVRGFTLVELLVSIAIISVLASIVMVSVGSARENSRDKKRVADLGQITLAIKLYQTQNGYFPKETDGFNGEICPTCSGSINDAIRLYMGSVPVDPKGTGNYYYYYDGRHNCGGNPNQAVLFARTMETEAYKNHADLMCSSWGSEGGGNNNSHRVLIGPSGDN
jgi:prepilin-type N-terminal cleavage/methylation domain-containing protein